MAVILDNIPVHAPSRKRVEKYPFVTMEVGQSFLAIGVKNPEALAARARRIYKPKLFYAEETSGGWRIGRTA
jgi:hypothetical protein